MTRKKPLFLFFNGLGTSLSAGVPIVQAFKKLEKRKAFKGAFRKEISSLRRNLEKGISLFDALKRTDGIPKLYVNMLGAGERSGNLPEITKKIASTLKRLMVLEKRILLALVYPAILLHLGIIAPEIGTIVNEGFHSFALSAGATLGWVYLSLLALFFAWKGLIPFPPFKRIFDFVTLSLPYIGRFLKDYHLHKFYLGFYNLYYSGLSMGKAFSESALIITQTQIQSLLKDTLQLISEDQPLVEALEENDFFPEGDMTMMIEGETTGKLDEQLGELVEIYEEKMETHLKILERAFPMIIYFTIMVFVGYKIVTFYKNYYDNLFNTFLP